MRQGDESLVVRIYHYQQDERASCLGSRLVTSQPLDTWSRYRCDWLVLICDARALVPTLLFVLACP